MVKYLYRAKNNQGQIVTGTVTANNEFDAEKALMDHRLVVIDIIPEKKFSTNTIFKSKITTKDRALFARQLATMISAGMTLTKSLSIVAQQARNDRLKEIYNNVYKDLEEGYSFSSALAKHPDAFDRVFIAIVKSGETTGNLEKVLTETANRLENESNFSSKIKGAMLYPAFILVALLLIGAYMMIKVIPQLKSIFEQAGSNLPWVTRALIAVSNFLTHYWWAALVALALIIIAARYWIISDLGARTINRWEISIPGIKQLTIGMYMSRFARVMEMLILAGVPLIDGLKIAAGTMNNQVFEEGINEMIVEVEKGVPLSVPILKNEDFPSLLGQMVAVGEQTGKMDEVLGKVAEYYEEETDQRIKSISTLVEPVILVIIGAGVAFLVFAVLMPIYNIAQIQ